MEPGRELDKLVAEAMGQTDFDHPSFEWMEKTFEGGDGYEGFYCPRCGAAEGDTGPCVKNHSTDWAAAGPAWEWLEQNHPWKTGEWKEDICLGRNSDGQPSVIILEMQLDNKPNEYISGESYPHAIALAVVEAAKVKGMLT